MADFIQNHTKSNKQKQINKNSISLRAFFLSLDDFPFNFFLYIAFTVHESEREPIIKYI